MKNLDTGITNFDADTRVVLFEKTILINTIYIQGVYKCKHKELVIFEFDTFSRTFSKNESLYYKYKGFFGEFNNLVANK